MENNYARVRLVPALTEIMRAYVEQRITADDVHCIVQYVDLGIACHQEEDQQEEHRQEVDLKEESLKVESQEVSQEESPKQEAHDEPQVEPQEANHKEEEKTKKGSPPEPLFTKEEKEKEENTHTLKKIQKKVFFPSFEEVKEFGLQCGASAEEIEKFFNYYESTEWTNDKGKEIQNWQSRLKLWIAEDNKRNKEDDAAGKRKGTGAKGCASVEEQQQRVVEYLDAHYPVAAGMDERAAAERSKNGDSLLLLSQQMGQAPVVRLMVKKLCVLDCKMKPDGRWQTPKSLASMARQLLNRCAEISLYKYSAFLDQIASGTFPSLDNGLRPPRLMRALTEYLAPPKTQAKKTVVQEAPKYKTLYE